MVSFKYIKALIFITKGPVHDLKGNTQYFNHVRITCNHVKHKVVYFWTNHVYICDKYHIIRILYYP